MQSVVPRGGSTGLARCRLTCGISRQCEAMVLELRVTRRAASLVVGRLFLRSWPPYAWFFPAGYIQPQPVYMVEWVDYREGREGEVTQMGAFTHVEEAEALMAYLEATGWTSLHINYVTVHERLVDWKVRPVDPRRREPW